MPVDLSEGPVVRLPIMKNPNRPGGTDPNDRGNDQPGSPDPHAEWPPDSAFISAVELPHDVVQEVVGIVKPFFPHADVRFSPDKRRVGIWTTASPNANISAARDRGLAKLALQPQFNFVLSINSSMFLGIGDVIWKQLPKKYNQWGNEAAGPDDTTVVLERFDLSLVAPNKIHLHLHGVAPGAVAGIISPGFDYTQIDTLTIDHDMHIRSEAHESVDTDPGILKILNAILEGIKASWAGIGGAVAAFAGALDGANFGAGGPNAGSFLANRLPRQILLPGTQQKIVLSYQSVFASPDFGLLIQIASAVRNREPSVSLTTSRVSVPSEVTAARAEVTFTARDFREPQAHWETDGQVTTHGHTAVITYQLPQPHPVHLTHTVRVKLTDDDGDSASAHIDVTIDSRPDADDPPHGPPHQPR
jgi:hypothetical protein